MNTFFKSVRIVSGEENGGNGAGNGVCVRFVAYFRAWAVNVFVCRFGTFRFGGFRLDNRFCAVFGTFDAGGGNGGGVLFGAGVIFGVAFGDAG